MQNSEEMMHTAEAAGIRVSIVGGLSLWEAGFTIRHQRPVERIRASIRFHAAEAVPEVVVSAVHIRFPDGSCLCPDVAIFPREPDELDTAITLMPEVVIEIISRNYAAKDLLIGVPFYQQVGIRDIVVLDPDTGEVKHWQTGASEETYTSPAPLTFLCGCTCTV